MKKIAFVIRIAARPARWRIAVLSVFLVVAATGCGSGSSPDARHAEGEKEAVSAAAGQKPDPAVILNFPVDPDSAEVKVDLGSMSAGEVIERGFGIRNNGNAPFVITEVERSCGCTDVDFPRKPVRPGETAPAAFVYDSKGKKGVQTGTLVLRASTGERFVLRFEAVVR